MYWHDILGTWHVTACSVNRGARGGSVGLIHNQSMPGTSLQNWQRVLATLIQQAVVQLTAQRMRLQECFQPHMRRLYMASKKHAVASRGFAPARVAAWLLLRWTARPHALQ